MGKPYSFPSPLELHRNSAGMLDADADAEAERRRRCRRRRLLCLIIIPAAVVLIVVALIITAVVVFKPRDPEISVESVTVQGFRGWVRPVLAFIDFNVTLGMGVWVHNPNHASFRYGNSTAQIFYRGALIGDAALPPGNLRAGGSAAFNVTVVLLGDRVLAAAVDGDLVRDVLAGAVPLISSTRVAGRITVLGVFRHHAVSSSVCNFTVSVPSGNLTDRRCSHSLKL